MLKPEATIASIAAEIDAPSYFVYRAVEAAATAPKPVRRSPTSAQLFDRKGQRAVLGAVLQYLVRPDTRNRPQLWDNAARVLVEVNEAERREQAATWLTRCARRRVRDLVLEHAVQLARATVAEAALEAQPPVEIEAAQRIVHDVAQEIAR